MKQTHLSMFSLMSLNAAGAVSLASTDPKDPPGEGEDTGEGGEDDGE